MTFTVYIETDDEAKLASLPDRIIKLAAPAFVSQPSGGVYQFRVGAEREANVRERLQDLAGDIRVVES